MGQKFWCFGIYRNHDSTNYKIFRYADALLLLAEAWCEKGDYSKSLHYLNMVRKRAQIDDYSFISEVKLRGEIRDERARELFGEFGRKYDLVRWGIWYEQVLAYLTYNKAQENVRPCHEYYPIPDVQCARSGKVEHRGIVPAHLENRRGAGRHIVHGVQPRGYKGDEKIGLQRPCVAGFPIPV